MTTYHAIKRINSQRCSHYQHNKKPDKFTRRLSVFAVIISLISVIFVFLQYNVTKDTAHKQLRAYVVPDSIIFQKIGTPITLKLVVNNMGQTPAYNISQACIFRISPAPYNYSTAEFKKDTQRGIAILGSSKPISFDNMSTTFSEKEIGYVLSEKYKLFYYAIVRYSDIFKQGHILHVCYEYSVESNSFIAMPDCNYEE